MALATTTLSSAVAVNDNSIVVASATSVAAGRLIRVDQEMMQVAKGYVTASTTVPVTRGQNGSVTAAHVVTANVTHGDAADFPVAAPFTSVTFPTVRATQIISVTATSTLTLPPGGEDLRVILNGTSVITLTIPVPTKDMDGVMLTVISGGAAAHVITYTSGLGGAGSSYDAITNNATGQGCWVAFAANGFWCIPQAPALTGTVTNITGGIA